MYPSLQLEAFDRPANWQQLLEAPRVYSRAREGSMGKLDKTVIKKYKAKTIDYGDPGRSRTCDLPLRRGLLYPTELQGQSAIVAFPR